ncbi:MAG TPA: hypothetical protein VFG50_06365 [Rhodothermales bacterium]|nr:hypothetical protein [Rhodothermales bacterium]
MRTTYYHGSAVQTDSPRGWLVSALLFPACVYYLLNPASFTILDKASFYMYEMGHYGFAIFGGSTQYAGGSIGQLVIPLLLVFFFLVYEYAFGLQVFLFWLGQNLVNLSTYLSHTSAPHPHPVGVQDWQMLVATLGVSDYSLYIGALLFAVGCMCFLASTLTPRFVEN